MADAGNSTIRRITPTGVMTTVAGKATLTGSTAATAAAARFNLPSGVATDSAGNVYVAVPGNGTIDGNSTIRKITPAGVVTTLAGRAPSTGSTDATGAAARFNFPVGAATDSA